MYKMKMYYITSSQRKGGFNKHLYFYIAQNTNNIIKDINFGVNVNFNELVK